MTRVFLESVDAVDWTRLRDALIAGDFDNGRTPEEYRASHANSHAWVVVDEDGEYIANARLLSDGVCNAYLVDVWTAPSHRRRGLATDVVRRLLARVPGQHVYLFTDGATTFYSKLGFREQPVGMGLVVGTWLRRDE